MCGKMNNQICDTTQLTLRTAGVHPELNNSSEMICLTEFEKNLVDYHEIFNIMTIIMKENNGMGIAGVQVGFNKRCFIMKSNNISRVFVNPTIISSSQRSNEYVEGCLSIKGYVRKTNRPAEIELEYYDEYCIYNKKIFTGLEAICIQHELDHLDGKLINDY